MKRLTLALASLVFAGSASAAGGGALPYEFEPDVSNHAALQRGAKDYMAYCSGCHSMKHIRYSRIAQDADIPLDLLQKYLMATSDKPADPILSAIPAAEAAEWFGQTPPDLSLTSRLRTPSWVYSYLMTFYLDESKPTGVNNLVLPGASMPHVLGSLQGWQVHTGANEAPAEDTGGHHGPVIPLELAVEGSLSPRDYKARVADITTFMAYVSEPGKEARISLGLKVMMYLLVLLFLSYLLKKEFWRDVH